MSDLAKALSDLQPRASGTPCRTCMTLETLDDEDAAALRDLLDQPKGNRVSADQLAQALSHLDNSPSRQSIEKHRRDRHG